MHKSVSEFLNFTVPRDEFFEKIFERYVGARLFKVSAIFGHLTFAQYNPVITYFKGPADLVRYIRSPL